ncbi:MAG: hypothetical protein IPN34_25490 [Planctomycetes bacterium]|nr:hypothetical protein [Planctomycetota bacterium]
MSTVGRIFLVLNLVLTFILCGFVAAYLYAGMSYRQAYEAVMTTANTDVTQAQQERDTFKAQAESSEGENKALRQQVQDLAKRADDAVRAYVTERSSMETLAAKMGDFSGRLDGWDGIYRDLQAKTGELNKELEGLKVAQAQAAEDQRLARNREVAAAASLIRSENQLQALMDQNSQLLGKMDEKDATIAVYTQLYGGLGEGIAPPNLVGRVTSVAADGKILTVELSGLVNGDPKAGWQLALYNEREFKGFVAISHVQGGGVVTCRLVWPAQGASAPTSGDRVASYSL